MNPKAKKRDAQNGVSFYLNKAISFMQTNKNTKEEMKRPVKKKVLFTATGAIFMNAFMIPYLKYFQEQGYEVHVATNGKEEMKHCDVKHIVPIERSPYKWNNIKAIFQMRKLLKENKYELIHTHTPMGSVVTRIAALKTRKKNKTRVIYTAHGFHFYEGAPAMNWLVFYPTEKILARYTDTLITINQEDYNRAKNKFKTRVEYVPGVGIDEQKFNFKMSEFDKSELRKSLGLKHDDFLIIYPAELNTTKRQVWLINTVKDLMNENPDIHLLLPGRDSLDGKCQKMAKEFNLENNIHFLGFRNDIPKLMNISDLSVSSSSREGQGLHIVEAMCVGLPIIVSDCRGIRELIQNDKNGFVLDLDDEENFVNRIKEVKKNNLKISLLCSQAKIDSKQYTLDKIMEQISNIYNLLTEEKYKVDNPILSIAKEDFYEKLDVTLKKSKRISRENKQRE